MFSGGYLCVSMIFCGCGFPCFAFFWCEIVLWIVWLAFSPTEIFLCGIEVGKIFW